MKEKEFYKKTWFIVLMLLVLAPLGIFLMFKYMSWRVTVKVPIAVIALVCFVIGVIGTNGTSAAPKTPSNEITNTGSADHSNGTDASITTETPAETAATTTDTPVSNEDKIINAAKEEFGEENFISVEYNPDNNYALIKAKGKENLTSKATVKGMYLSISNILKSLNDLEDTDIDFNIVYPLQDKYGNAEDTIVIKATYTYDSRSKINWDNFLWENIPDIADEWWMHGALKSVLD